MRLVAVALGLMLLAGCAGPSFSVTRTVTLSSTSFAEVNLSLKEGDKISWDWNVDGGKEVHFNIHTHIAGSAPELVSKHGTSDKGSYTAKGDGVHSFMWEYEGAGVAQLHYTVNGAGTLKGVVPN